MVPEFGHEDVREIFVGRYRLIYHVADSRYVDVLAFIHGARDLLSTWERESRPDPTA
jgi:plasmid stabilization system protein ParE